MRAYGGCAYGTPRNCVTVPSVVPRTVALLRFTVGSQWPLVLLEIEAPSVGATRSERRSTDALLSPMMYYVVG